MIHSIRVGSWERTPAFFPLYCFCLGENCDQPSMQWFQMSQLERHQITPCTKHEPTPWSTSGRLISHQTSFWSQAERYQCYAQMLAVGGVYTGVIYGLKNWQEKWEASTRLSLWTIWETAFETLITRMRKRSGTEKDAPWECRHISNRTSPNTSRKPQAETFTWRWRSRPKGGEKFPWKGFNQMLSVLLKCPFCSLT